MSKISLIPFSFLTKQLPYRFDTPGKKTRCFVHVFYAHVVNRDVSYSAIVRSVDTINFILKISYGFRACANTEAIYTYICIKSTTYC